MVDLADHGSLVDFDAIRIDFGDTLQLHTALDLQTMDDMKQARRRGEPSLAVLCTAIW